MTVKTALTGVRLELMCHDSVMGLTTSDTVMTACPDSVLTAYFAKRRIGSNQPGLAMLDALGNQLSLCFSDAFPDSTYAGRTIALDASGDKSVWRIGRTPEHCDLTIRSQEISRAHCTIFYQFNCWYLMDGCFFADQSEATKELKAGEYNPSTNGTWLDGQRLGYRDPARLEVDARIVIGGPSFRIIVRGAKTDTLDQSVWADDDWPVFVPKSKKQEQIAPPLHPEIEQILIAEAAEKDSAAKLPEIKSQWQLAYAFGSWLLSTPKSVADFGYRFVILALLGVSLFFAFKLANNYIDGPRSSHPTHQEPN